MNQNRFSDPPESGDVNEWEVVVIGAGAAGLMAAYRAASRGLKTILVEKNRKIGVKILMSGGTRCNITHNTDVRGIIAAYGRHGKFLHSALAALGPNDVVGLLNDLNVSTKIESTGKVFPASDRAIDVRDALVRLVRTTDCVIRTEAAVLDLDIEAERWIVTLAAEKIVARHVILTSGGKSYPGCGTIGEGYGWAERFGHTIIELVPALAPIVVGDQWPRDLAGVTIEDVHLTVVRGPKEKIEESRTSFLFTHFGFSGPGPMNVSRAFGRFDPNELKLRCDFWPAEDSESLRSTVREACIQHPTRAIGAVFRPELSRRLVDQILNFCGVDPLTRCAEVPRKGINRSIELLKSMEFKIQGTRGFKKAEVTAGGVSLREVNSSTMQSKRQPGLYFAGEILDLDGPIGGYNFQAAFSTGWLAGSKVGS